MSYRISREQRKAFGKRRYERYCSRRRPLEHGMLVDMRYLLAHVTPQHWEPKYSIGKRFSKQQLDDWFMSGNTRQWDFSAMLAQGLLKVLPQWLTPMRELGGFSVTAGGKK